MIEEKLDDDFISHKTADYLNVANNRYVVIFEINNEKYTEDNISVIMGAGEIFRANVQQIIKKIKYNSYKSKVFPLDFLEKMLIKSGFDWTNKEKYSEFEEWYVITRDENMKKLTNRNP